jgi:dTMP kinase
MTKNPYKGKFIVFEGIDGAGGETQSKLLFNYFKKQKKPVKKLSYPDYRGPIGKLIHQFLHKKYNFSPEVQFLLYFTDFLKDKEKIEKWKRENKIIISDRYFTSTLAYQGQKGFSIEKALKIFKIFDLPKPDLIIYLKISAETSIQRKFKEKRSLDRHEADKKFLEKLSKFYEKLIKNQIFGRWVTADGERPIEEVSKEIRKIALNKLKQK